MARPLRIIPQPKTKMNNDFTIHRIVNRSQEDEDKFCASCDTHKPKGFWMFAPTLIGLEAIFVCDDCLDAARKHKFVTNGKPKPI